MRDRDSPQPAELEWHQVRYGDMFAGEVLCAFELVPNDWDTAAGFALRNDEGTPDFRFPTVMIITSAQVAGGVGGAGASASESVNGVVPEATPRDAPTGSRSEEPASEMRGEFKVDRKKMYVVSLFLLCLPSTNTISTGTIRTAPC
jgi:hypothetical protein